MNPMRASHERGWIAVNDLGPEREHLAGPLPPLPGRPPDDRRWPAVCARPPLGVTCGGRPAVARGYRGLPSPAAYWLQVAPAFMCWRVVV